MIEKNYFAKNPDDCKNIIKRLGSRNTNSDEPWEEDQYLISDLVNNNYFNFSADNIPDYQTIRNIVIERANFRFNNNFNFRPNQLDTIVSIILGFFKKDNIVIEAPTGSGKSIIALLVADVLNYYFNLSGYILISDLSLLDQYTHDVDTYFPEFAFLKGQDNYTCTENGLTYPFGVCKLMGMSYKNIESEMPCANECPYLLTRRKAISAPVVLMTYQAWLLQRNYIPMLMASCSYCGTHPFHQREFTICDEAHKLAEIVQDHFSPIINKEDYNRLAEIVQEAHSLFKKISISNMSVNPLYYKEKIDRIFNTNDDKQLFDAIKDYYLSLTGFGDLETEIKSAVGEKNATKPSKRHIKLMTNCDWAREYCCKIEDYISMISETGLWAMVKNIQSEDTIKFNCLDERYLIREHFHKKCGNRLYMSATIGEPMNYINSISSDNNRYINIPSTFDFSRSPIYYDNEYKLSYDKKGETLPKIINKIVNIINNHPNIRGIIQTGSYAFANSLYMALPENLKNRVLMYNDSKDKEYQLNEYKNSADKIIIGPSLLEGIDLKDDLCRFIIIMKVPYPSLGDKFIERKFKTNPQWYMWKTCNSLIQGIGRGVRNENDWCETYIVDGTFDNILMRHRSLLPQHILNRFRHIKN